ncbi:hypothetical protein G4228_010824 [Cervus hanglu yarkandensis]|nr:hypothetical protein G4228_010824 [Cervus hanglu yarkandensis]
MLYPAYYSYKAVKTKNVKEYVRWMMYWIVFALYTVIETIADQTVAWFPLYYELKIAFVIWLLSPYTRGASLIYRKFLHPLLSSKEREIDDYIVQAKERGYETMVNFGRQGLNLAATAAVTAAVKSQGAITERLRSFSMHDLTAIQGDEPVGQRPYQPLPETKKKSKPGSGEAAGYGIPLRDGDEKTDEEAEGPYSDDEMLTHKGLRRSQSMKSVKTVKGRKELLVRLDAGSLRTWYRLCGAAAEETPALAMADEKGVKTENNDCINLKVVGQDGSVVQFKIKRHTPLSKLMKAYCERQGLSMRQIRFPFVRQPISEIDTPAQLEEEDEDTIDVFQQQTGGVF